MKELFLFVRPPRPLWPFSGPSTAFWPPLAFASLAAALREHIHDLSVSILDAPALEMGWRTLESEIRRRQPAYVGIGEEAVSCAEGLRLAGMAKQSGAQVIAGGCFFGHVAPEVLRTGLVDVVVHGEAEITIAELVEAMREGNRAALRRVAGISFADAEEIVANEPRQPMPDLDALPVPAYDLLPVHRYGARSRNHPNLAAIELGRGCVGSCDFCVLWRQMGRFVAGQPAPLLRTKSPERLREEIYRLVHHHDRRYLGWVDPCFNAHPHVPGALAELLLRDGLRIGQSAWVRTDALVRDAASGALAGCVQAGLNEVYLGIERPDAGSLAALGKTSGLDHAREATRILNAEFPNVVVIGSFIYGLPDDKPATIRAIHRLACELELDEFFLIPMTPLPGTASWRPEFWDPTGRRFRQFNFLPGSRLHPHQPALERALLFSVLFNWHPARLRWWLSLLGPGDARKRRVNWRLMVRYVRFDFGPLLRRALSSRAQSGLIFPSWYET